MKYCPRCQITVKEKLSRCPLCGATLTGDETGCVQSYPKTAAFFRNYNFVLRLMVFLSVVAGAACLIINYLVPVGNAWSLLVVGGILYAWAATMFSIRKGYNSGFNILLQMITANLFVVIIDFLLGFQGWSLTYAIPCICTASNLGMTVMVILRHFNLTAFAIYLLFSGGIGLVLPLILWLTRTVSANWPSLICAGYALLILLATLIFADRKTKVELKKRLHL